MHPPEPFDIVEFMKEKLPPYNVTSFLTADFDSTEAISLMNTSENLYYVIESFIEKYYSDNKYFCCGPVHPIIFPPGHRLRICNFVSNVMLKLKRMGQVSSSNSCGKKKSK